ncbi:MAG: GNAT family N-acetyltransferase [Roseovarius sp.]|uniref:GNAT family N-acetyltransferase n=1 Tax=Roseovarius sp. TaxID=1486281 RepID=UPI0032EAF800
MARVRAARPEDAAEISAVLIASIRELCAPDHEGDAAAIEAWTANKTPEQVAVWLEGAHGVRVAVEEGEIVAVGAISGSVSGGGEVLLLYVAPEHRGKGHSAALLQAMEAELREAGHVEATLVSTKTAHGFYLRHGWRNDGPEVDCFRTRGQPMRKALGRDP